MSSWWSIDLFVIGDFNRLEKFDDALPSLFHEMGEVDRRPCGAVVAHVAQNYGGGAAMEAVIARYPDLIFSGTMSHKQAQPGDAYWSFTARKGESRMGNIFFGRRRFYDATQDRALGHSYRRQARPSDRRS